MSIRFQQTPGMVLICDFCDTIPPEIWKIRPVVIISAPNVRRYNLSTVVPLSTTRPPVICAHHVLLRPPPYPSAGRDVWAKCDLVMSVSHTRLDRLRFTAHRFDVAWVTAMQLNEIRVAAARSFGVDVTNGRP
jgi:mRNA interferase MazF